ncbi:ammonium transporter [Actinospongicola halichondriae]|uniref:ammonium transporter n=1 Tax=Actinospongicola halichondriae TaxID=3236844 RepID=UPI003D4CEC6F
MEGNNAWLLISSALVLFMIPGLALFYGGMVRSKNVLNMLLMNVYCALVIPVIWVVAGYSLALNGNSDSQFIGNTDLFGLSGVDDGATLLGIAFLMTFAAITPALISGAIADRMKFAAWAVFVPVWSILVYCPVVFWIYGLDGDGELVGWLGARGSLDFAGGTAIHINAGVAALAMVLVLGKRKGWPREAMPPHNLPLVMLGTGILWFGWFGFNAGSAFAADDIAIQAFMNTFLAAAAGGLAWLVIERIKDGHFTTLGACSGIVAGLVAITPAAGFVGGMAGIVFGVVAGVVCYLAIQLKYRFGYDDSLDVVGVHMVGGIIGGLLIGFFADSSIIGRTAGDFHDGVFFGGGTELLIEQALSIVVVLVYSFVVTFALAKILSAVMGIRVDEVAESGGLDQSEHAESGYSLADLGSMQRG